MMTRQLLPKYNSVPQEEVESISFIPEWPLTSFFLPVTKEPVLEFYGFY